MKKLHEGAPGRSSRKELVNLREHGDELWRQQLRPQSSDLSNVAQKSQHVPVKFLLVWKLLQ